VTSVMNRKIDGVGLFLNWLVFGCVFISTFALPLSVYERLDPYYYLCRDLTPSSMKDVLFFKVISVVFRVILVFGVIALFGQVIVFGLILYSLNNRAASASVFYLSQLHSRDKGFARLVQYTHWYNELRIILRFVEPLKGGLEFLFLSLGFVVTVMSNWISLKLHTVIPMPTYLMFPFLSVVCPIISLHLIPKAVALSIDSRFVSFLPKIDI